MTLYAKPLVYSAYRVSYLFLNLFRKVSELFFGTSIVKDIVGRKILGRKYSHGGEYAFFGGQ